MKTLLLFLVAGLATASGQIVVDGNASEWSGIAPASENSSVYSSTSAGTATKLNEWIWHDEANDQRTDFTPSVDDIREIRLASDGTNLYYLCRLPANQVNHPLQLQITLRRPGSTSTQTNLLGFSDTQVPAYAAWDYAIVTPGGSGGSVNHVWNPLFSVTNAGTYSQNMSTGVLEGSVPWAALGGSPGSLTFLITFSIYGATNTDETVNIDDANSNCLDCVSTTSGSTWNIVNGGSLDYAAPIQFLIDDEVLPIRLASFAAMGTNEGSVRLEWTTLSETNNYGFYVERKRAADSGYQTLPGGFVPGRGTSITPFNYVYTDACALPGEYSYRLRQVDLDGTVRFSDAVRVTVTAAGGEDVPGTYSLSQNFPNPFNPSTVIRYALTGSAFVNLTVFNGLGERVATLVNGEQGAGYHEITFDASGFASGVYYYRVTAGEYTQTRKMVLTR